MTRHIYFIQIKLLKDINLNMIKEKNDFLE